MTAVLAIGATGLAAWLYMLMGRGFFWLARERDDEDMPPDPQNWPAVTAVVPARNEADVIGQSVSSLLGQDYPGHLRVVLIDDASDDRTAEHAIAAAAKFGAGERLTVIRGQPLPKGWTGKLWAVNQGVAEAVKVDPPEFLLITDADIAHAPDNLRRLVAHAVRRRLVLASLMAELSVSTWAERLLIPAFVFFFDMLYPFAWVNDPKRRLAAAAGGCMLVQAEALAAAGGIASIRGEIIDDCALGARLKRQGPIWLGLTHRAVSLRPYASFAEIGRMISRSAYAQLGYSPLILAGTLLGLALAYLGPPIVTFMAVGPARWLGLAAWTLMAISYQPMLSFYRRSPFWGVALPLIGAIYAGFTLMSAIQVWRGRGGLWKGRIQAMAASE